MKIFLNIFPKIFSEIFQNKCPQIQIPQTIYWRKKIPKKVSWKKNKHKLVNFFVWTRRALSLSLKGYTVAAEGCSPPKMLRKGICHFMLTTQNVFKSNWQKVYAFEKKIKGQMSLKVKERYLSQTCPVVVKELSLSLH